MTSIADPSPTLASRSAAHLPRLALPVALLFPLGLALDRLAGIPGTIVTTIATYGLFAMVWSAADRADRRTLLVCVAWATFGELVLTEVLGLYEYRLGFLPPYVPPGHALLFQLGVWITPRFTPSLQRTLRLSAVPITLATFTLFGDAQSLVFLAIFVALITRGPSPAIYGTMFFLALALEWIGTSIGTWAWAARDPWLGIPTCNPPVAAGVFYCMLDALTLGSGAANPVPDTCAIGVRVGDPQR